MLYLLGLCYYHDQEPRECLTNLEKALQHEPAAAILSDLYVALLHLDRHVPQSVLNLAISRL
jgi:hypothetical protein